MKKKTQTYKVRCARTYAWYAFIDAKDQEDAERWARKEYLECDPTYEATHIHDTFEVEEAE